MEYAQRVKRWDFRLRRQQFVCNILVATVLHTRGAVPTSAHASASYSSIPTASMHTWTFPHAVWDTRRHREGTGPWCSTTAEGGLVLFLITASKFWWSELSVPVCIPTSKPCVHNSQHWKFALLNQGSSYDIKVCIVDYKIGAKVITNVDASNDPNFSRSRSILLLRRYCKHKHLGCLQILWCQVGMAFSQSFVVGSKQNHWETKKVRQSE